MAKVYGTINPGVHFEGTYTECEEYINACEAADMEAYGSLEDCEEYYIKED